MIENKVSLISITPNAENNIAYIARVSNPQNQDNKDIEKLISYCIKHQHWSIFEQSSFTVQIDTAIAIATQILRHRSFTFQQFSQRYADASLINDKLSIPEFRGQDNKNRQNSLDNVRDVDKIFLEIKYKHLVEEIHDFYNHMLEMGVAKECARFILPQSTMTKMYMTGNIRSWITYIQLREKNGTQKEHQDVALKIKEIFKKELPIISKALGWL